MLKVDAHTISLHLQRILKEVWETESIPTEWKYGSIVKLPKRVTLHTALSGKHYEEETYFC